MCLAIICTLQTGVKECITLTHDIDVHIIHTTTQAQAQDFMYRITNKELINAYPLLALNKARIPSGTMCIDINKGRSLSTFRLLHEISHSIEFWIRGKKDRLRMENYGYPTVAVTEPLSINSLLVESRVFAISIKLSYDLKINDVIDPVFSCCLKTEKKRIQHFITNTLFSLRYSFEKFNPNIPSTPEIEDVRKRISNDIDMIADLDLLKIWSDICNFHAEQESMVVDTNSLGAYNTL